MDSHKEPSVASKPAETPRVSVMPESDKVVAPVTESAENERDLDHAYLAERGNELFYVSPRSKINFIRYAYRSL